MKKRRKSRSTIILSIIFLLVLSATIYVYVSIPNNQVKPKYEGPSESPNTEKKEPQERRMSLVMVGDALIHGAVFADAQTGKNSYNFKPMFTSIEKIIKDYDLKYYNQESIIGGGTPQHYPRLNSPDAIGSDLVSIGFNLVSLANNHSLDRNESGILYSNAFWKKQKNVITAGTYSSWEERNALPVYEQNGIKYAFLSYTMRTNGLTMPAGKEYLVNVYEKEQVKKDIETVKEKGAEVIMVAMHWGNEYTHVPTDEQKEVAKYLSSLGVNLIIGSHPHVIQPIGYVDDMLVIYSLGNFISAQKVLGLEKIIGLLVGLDIVIGEDGKVRFENMDTQLHYTYYDSSNRNFKVYPFSELTDKILKNHEAIEKEYMEIVSREV